MSIYALNGNISECVFEGCSAGSCGGGIFYNMAGNCNTLNLKESEFTGNSGGAIYYHKYGNCNMLNITESEFTGNSANIIFWWITLYLFSFSEYY